MKDFADILVPILITLGVFFLAYVATRFLPSRFARTGKTSHLRIQERVMLGKDRQVAIIRVGEQYFLVGVAGQSVQIGPAIDPGVFQSESPAGETSASPDSAGAPGSAMTFSDILRRAGLPFPGIGKDHREDPHP